MRPSVIRGFCYFVFLALCSLPFAGVSSCNAARESTEIHFTNPDGTSSPAIRAELALTPSEQQLGLMYRKTLPEAGGMLFVFRDEMPRSFWMKNTYLELDIIFLDKELKVVSISERAVPLTETPRPSGVPAQYVLEIAGGRSKSWGIVPGSKAKLSKELPPAPH